MTQLYIKSIFLFLSLTHGRTSESNSSVSQDLYNGQVLLSNGALMYGEKYWENASGNQRGFAYYGYKYGKAGRFQHSRANSDFEYLADGDRLKPGPVCPQLPGEFPGLEFFNRNLTMDEDCLYLDIYVPPIRKNQGEARPVLFWIHGGSYRMGDKDLYNAYILSRAVNAIVVTVNYRLSIFGFLSTGDESARGNWAIGDLKLALNWTVANAAAFNGDPKKVTICGHSAGAALVSAMMLDDSVRGRVFATVALSGNIVRPRTTLKDPASGTIRLAANLGCTTENSRLMVECLRSQSVQTLLNATLHVLENGLGGFTMYYAPVIDGLHIPRDPADILTERALKQLSPRSEHAGTYIAGFLARDAAFFVITQPQLLDLDFTLPLVSQLLTGLLATGYPECPQRIPVQLELVLGHYGLSQTASAEELRRTYFKIATDAMFGVGAMQESILYAKESTRGNNQMSVISFDPDFKGMGAFHMLDVLHLFRGPLDVLMKDKMSAPLTAAMHDFFREILYNGQANGPFFGEEGNYLELNQQAQWITKKQDFRPLLAFWDEIGRIPCPGGTGRSDEL